MSVEPQSHVPARSPDTLLLLAVLAVAGAVQIVTGTESGVVGALVHGWMATAWSIIFTLGAALALAGTLWRDPITGPMIELVGRVMLGPTSAAYALALVVAAGPQGALVAGIYAALGLASGWRVWQVVREVRDVQDNLRTIARHQSEGDDR